MLVEVPGDCQPGGFFCIVSTNQGQRRALSISCPQDAGPGDVLQISLPPDEQLVQQEDFLARLGQAEARDTHRRAHPPRYLVSEMADPVHGWRLRMPSKTRPSAASNPYLSEQQRTALRMQEAHQQAIVRDRRRTQLDAIERDVLESSGVAASLKAAGRQAAPALAVRIPKAQRDTIAAMAAQLDQQQEQIQNRNPSAAQPSWAMRAPNVAAAQHEATMIAMRRQATRDPRGQGHQTHL